MLQIHCATHHRAKVQCTTLSHLFYHMSHTHGTCSTLLHNQCVIFHTMHTSVLVSRSHSACVSHHYTTCTIVCIPTCNKVCVGHCYTVSAPNCHSNPTMRQLASVTQPVLKHCHPYGSPWFSWSAQHYDPGNFPQCRCCEFKSSFYCHPLNPYVEGPTATCRWL